MEPDEEPKLSLNRYLASYMELLLDPKEYFMVIDELLPLIDRDSIEHTLRTKPSTYTRDELYQIYQADLYLIEHAGLAARWFRTKPPHRRNIPKDLWWWYFHLIADGLLHPNPHQAYKKWLEMAGY